MCLRILLSLIEQTAGQDDGDAEGAAGYLHVEVSADTYLMGLVCGDGYGDEVAVVQADVGVICAVGLAGGDVSALAYTPGALMGGVILALHYGRYGSGLVGVGSRGIDAIECAGEDRGGQDHPCCHAQRHIFEIDYFREAVGAKPCHRKRQYKAHRSYQPGIDHGGGAAHHEYACADHGEKNKHTT